MNTEPRRTHQGEMLSRPRLRPATTYPKRRDDVGLLVLDARRRRIDVRRFGDLGDELRAGDLLVVNDAATLPGSLSGRDARGWQVELRLCAQLGPQRFRAVSFGSGDWRLPTEQRPPPPPLEPGDSIELTTTEPASALAAMTQLTTSADGAVRGVPRSLHVSVRAIDADSPRLIDIELDCAPDVVWSWLYALGRPIQYAYLDHDLPLWAVQNSFAGRPWSFEMPSAGRPLTWTILQQLANRGVKWSTLTHAAGLSSTGNVALDARLPLPERYSIPEDTAAAVADTHASGGRVIAVGTTVVRALESAVGGATPLRAANGVTTLRLGAGYAPRVVDGLISGIHAEGESHFDLLRAFAPDALLREALTRAAAANFECHELGDSMLVLANGREAVHGVA